MARCGLPFDQRNASSLAGERDGSGTARHSTTEDENFVLQRNLFQIRRSNGNLLLRTRYAAIGYRCSLKSTGRAQGFDGALAGMVSHGAVKLGEW